MIRQMFSVSVSIFLVLTQVACGGGGNANGACVRGSGATATCGDDFTATSCTLVNGTGFYEGKTCKELGFK
jgi:hypothetical protein